MGLLNSTKFESDDAATTTAVPTGDTGKPTTAVAAKPAQSGAVAVSVIRDVNAITRLKDALPVEYNTLSQVTATNGNFMERESKTILGDTVVFTLLSFQDSWVVSPGDDKAPKELVKYSVDGKVCNDGTLCADWLADLKSQGWLKAKLNSRAVLVGALESAVKTDKLNGELVQLDLSPQSRIQWTRYMAKVAYNLQLGIATAEGVVRVKATAELAQNGANTFTLAKFCTA